MKHSAMLMQKIEKLTEYLINNTSVRKDLVEAYYEFCYELLKKARKLDESNNPDLLESLLEEDYSVLYWALYELVYGKQDTEREILQARTSDV